MGLKTPATMAAQTTQSMDHSITSDLGSANSNMELQNKDKLLTLQQQLARLESAIVSTDTASTTSPITSSAMSRWEEQLQALVGLPPDPTAEDFRVIQNDLLQQQSSENRTDSNSSSCEVEDEYNFDLDVATIYGNPPVLDEKRREMWLKWAAQDLSSMSLDSESDQGSIKKTKFSERLWISKDHNIQVEVSGNEEVESIIGEDPILDTDLLSTIQSSSSDAPLNLTDRCTIAGIDIDQIILPLLGSLENAQDVCSLIALLINGHFVSKQSVQTDLEHLEQERDHFRKCFQQSTAASKRLEALCQDLHQENVRLQRTLEKLQSQQEVVAYTIPSLPDKQNLMERPLQEVVELAHTLSELFVVRERHFATILRQRDAQYLLDNHCDTKNNTAAASSASTTESNQPTKREEELKKQVDLYVEKFKLVEETLSRSNALFVTFRAEMEQAASKASSLEAENEQLKSKVLSLSRNIFHMAEERTKASKLHEQTIQQRDRLVNLCRTLQSERTNSSQ